MISLDTKELMRLNKGFEKYQNAIPAATTNAALVKSARPMLNLVKQLVPIGDVISDDGWGARKGPDYRRGNRSTLRDVRISRIKPKGDEIARIMIGVNDKSGHVGWRTHFITHGWTDRGGSKHAGKDFLAQAYNSTIEEVQNTFYRELFTNLVKWGNANLPQGK
jgi:hypothetical protein